MSSRHLPSSRSQSLPYDPSAVADDILDSVFEDLDRSLYAEPEEHLRYPYFGSRLPLPPPKRSHAGILLIIGSTLVTLVAGASLWLSYSRSQSTVQSDPVPEQKAIFPMEAFNIGSPQPIPSPLVPGSNPVAKPVVPNQAEPKQILPSQMLRNQAEPHQTLSKPSRAVLPPKTLTPSKTGKNNLSPVQKTAVTQPVPITKGVVPKPPAPAITAPKSMAAPPVKLVGIVHNPGEPLALVIVDGVLKQVPVGQSVKGNWRVTSIQRQGVGISNGSENTTLPLRISDIKAN
jgi:hypothetical protein